MSSYPEFIAHCIEDLNIKLQAHETAWGLSESTWTMDQVDGTITFESPNDMIVTAPLQIIGIYYPKEALWQWSWANNTIRPPLTESADTVRSYGKEQGIESLTTPEVKADEEHACWEFTALACKLMDAQGALKTDMGDMVLFLAFGDHHIMENKPSYAATPMD